MAKGSPQKYFNLIFFLSPNFPSIEIMLLAKLMAPKEGVLYYSFGLLPDSITSLFVLLVKAFDVVF